MTTTSLSDASFPASHSFDTLATYIGSASSSELETATRSARGTVFAFTLRNQAGAVKSWHVDLRAAPSASSVVGAGAVPKGASKADVMLELSDEDFGRLIDGKANAQRLFMTGRLKVRGDVMKATRVEPLLNKMRLSETRASKL